MGNQLILRTLVVLAATGALYFALSSLYESRRIKRLGYIEARNIEIDDQIRRERRGSSRQRLRGWLAERGYDGDPAPFLMVVAFAYLILASVLALFGIHPGPAFALAAPVIGGGTLMALESARRRRVARGTVQIMAVLRNAIGYLSAGNTPQQAFLKAANDIGNPLRADLLTALAGQVGSVGLGSVMKPLADYYPDPATRLMIAALEINDEVGAPLVPTLKQAEELIRHKTELAAEAVAEVSQARFEFIGITIVIAIIALLLLFGGGDFAREAYTSPIGVVLLGVGLANFALGVRSTLKSFTKAKEGGF
jgi:Flp pilus assembly protein TadB